MSSIDTNISGGGFITQANGAVQGLNLLTGDSSASVISKLNTAFTNVSGKRTIVDKKAADFIGDVNYNIDLMSGGDTPDPSTDKITLPSVPKMLFIGNSYTLDSISYLPFILKAHGIDAVIGMIFKHGQTVQWYKENYTNTSAVPRLFVCDNTEENPQWYNFGTSFESVSSEWVFTSPQSAILANTEDFPVHDSLKSKADELGLDGTWDLISIQSFSNESFITTSTQYYKILEETFPDLVGYIQADLTALNCDFILGFTLPAHMPNSGTPNSIMSRTRDFVAANNSNTNNKKIDVVFPYGTAIFNARTHEEMRSMVTASEAVVSAYYPGRNLYGDTTNGTQAPVHLNEGLPCFIAALAVAQKLFTCTTNYEGQNITGNEIKPPENGVYPSGSEWKTWSESAHVRNPNGLDYIYGIDGSNGTKVRNGVIGQISRQWAKWFAEQAVTNPYSLVPSRIDGGSTNVTITLNLTNCTASQGTFLDGPNSNAVPQSLAYHDSVYVYIKPNTNYSITEVYWTVDWRVEEGSVNAFKAQSFSDYTKDGVTYKRYQFQNLRENIVIFATAT